MNLSDYTIIKKDGTLEPFKPEKIVNAVTKSSNRVMITLSEQKKQEIVREVEEAVLKKENTQIPVPEMHNLVELALDKVDPVIAKSYRDYRNYKHDFVHMMDQVYVKSQSIRHIGDKENSNTDSTLVATKRCLIFNELNKRLYRRFFMTKDELQACKEGYIYISTTSRLV